ncbi:MAG: hypothetical protein QG657_449, partial [Acidobacteriota bacterium]|nr:hypothetical protein [Acidobacteriota bacterium]
MGKLDPKHIENVLALTPLQEGILFHYLQDPQSEVYFAQLCLEISGEIDMSSFENAWNTVIETNEMLRTVFRWEKLEKPSQIILKEHKCKVIFYDLSDNGVFQKVKASEETKDRDRRETFDLHQVPFRITLCKMDEKKYEMIISNHHILYDGWSNGIILKEFFEAYHELCHGRGSIPIPVKPPFKEFIKWLHHRDKNQQEQSWREYLAGFETPSELPIKKRIDETTKAENYSFSLEEYIKGRLDDFVKNNRVTLASVFYTAWGILLQKYCDSEDVIFGTTVSGRSAGLTGIEDMVGLFINTIPLRVQSAPSDKMIDIVSAVERALQVREEFESTPLPDIRRYSTVGDCGRGSLFDMIVVIENYPLDNCLVPDSSNLSILSYAINELTHYDLTVSITLFSEIKVKFSYNRGHFDKSSIENLARHLKHILQSVIDNPTEAVSLLEVISGEEKNRILYEFNNTATEYPANKTIHQLFMEQAERTPDHIALVGVDPRVCAVSLSYRKLNKQSDWLSGLLIEKGVLPDTIVGIKMERSIEMIIGILGILKIGSAYLPIDPEYPQKRVSYMLRDSAAKILIDKPEARISKFETNSDVQKVNGQIKNRYLESTLVLNFEHLDFEYVCTCNFGFRISNFNPLNLAYIMYTSGSTGQPKGVMVSHRNAVRLVKNTNFVPLTEETRILQTGSPLFDAATFEILGSLLNGGQLILVDKEIIVDAQQLRDTLKDQHINTLWLSAPLFNQLQQQNIELFEPLSYLLVGGDVLSPEHINRVRHRFPFLKIINGYGPTENTTFSTTYLIEKEFEQRIPIGRPIANSTAYIYDKNNRMSPIGVWGELYVGGDGVACGYLNNPELTAERFKRDVISHSPLLINKPSNPSNDQYLMANDIFYKTGDLARWLPDGNIEFQGRIDKQVKIRGFRIELGEIERQLLEYGHIKEAVVIDRKTGEEKYICAYIVPDSNPAPEATELKSYLSRCLPGYMLPSFFVFMERIPLNQNGKIDQKALPEPGGGETTKEYTAPRDAVEKKLTEIWTEILKPNSFISIDENFFDLGGHSLNATQLTGRIHKVFNVKISLKEFFQSGCIREVAEYIKRAVEVEEEFTFIEPVEEKEYYPLSATQKRMYFLQQMDEAGIVYNIPSLMILEGVLDKNYLGSIFQKLIQRHESLRTSFITINDEPVQRIHDDVESDIEYKNSSTDYTVYTNKKDNCRGTPPWLPSIRSFDLSKAPLMRVELVEVEAEKNLLMVDMHHIITDGASMELFVKEFMELYAGLELPLLKLQYRDYVGWQSDKQKKNVLKTEEEYWLGQFREAPPVLDLPLDFPRPMVQSFGGRGYSFEITPGETTALKALALREGATLFIVLLSIYYVFLSRITGQEDIVAGTPVAGRSHTDLESIMGLFINTLALRNRPVWEKNFKEFLKEINENTLAAFANQDYPYEELVEKVTINREPGRNPLFDTMFTLQNTGSQEIKIPGLRLVPCEYENKTSKFDLSLTSVEVVGKLVFTFEYNTKLFREETIHRFNVYFKNIIHGIIECKERRVVDFKIVSEEEKNRILLEFNDVGVGYPKDRTIHQLFIEQASRTPDNIALLGADLRVCPPRNTRNVSLTYLELNKQSDRLAGLLIEKGVFPDTIVGIMVERSVEMIVGIMGILKSGCAYLPIDPGYSQERVNYMLQDSEVKLLVTINNKEGEKLRCWEGEIYYIEDPHRSSYFLSILPSNLLSSSYLAYLIYTSGSTSKPKGVMINHGSVVNLLFAMQDNYPFTAVDTYLLKTSIIFDVSVTELFGWSLGGGKLAVLEKAGERDPQVIIDWIEWYKVTHINFVPSMFNAFACRLDVENINRLSTLKYIFLAGETLLPEFVKKIRDMNTGIRLENIYGPTESTVYSSKYSLADWNGRGSIPIGKPMPNIKLYILDKNNNLQPLGIVGELAIAGVGLARGYLNRPELTAEKFKRNFISQLSLFISSNKNFANENSSNLTNDQCPLTNDYLYKTGDLARWRPDSNIEFLGRLDQQVKVRGFRVELGEIEGLLLKHDRVKNTVVVLKEDESGDNTLVAYFVSELELSDTGLREYLLKVLPDYMIPAYFVQMDKIPLTPSGKVDKRALPEPELKIG